MFKLAISLLNVTNAIEVEKFFCEHLGFTREFRYRLVETQANPCYVGLSRDGTFLSRLMLTRSIVSSLQKTFASRCSG
jgi:hypothetical protein